MNNCTSKAISESAAKVIENCCVGSVVGGIIMVHAAMIACRSVTQHWVLAEAQSKLSHLGGPQVYLNRERERERERARERGSLHF